MGLRNTAKGSKEDSRRGRGREGRGGLEWQVTMKSAVCVILALKVNSKNDRRKRERRQYIETIYSWGKKERFIYILLASKLLSTSEGPLLLQPLDTKLILSSCSQQTWTKCVFNAATTVH